MSCPSPVAEERKLSLFSTSNLVVASMVGAGVYTTSGFTLADLGSPAFVVLAWVVAGIIAICGAVSYGALASRFTESGGEYLFLSRAIHPAAGYVAGFVSIIAGFTGAIAFAARTLEAYLNEMPLLEHLPSSGIATLSIIVGAVLHGWYAKFGTRFQDGLIVAKALAAAIFVWLAVTSFPTSWPGWNETHDNTLTLGKFAVSLMWISLSYSGFNAAVYLSSEVKDANRNVPRAMWIATLVVTIIYVVLNAIFVYAPPHAQVAGNSEVALAAATAIGGNWFANLIRALIVLSLMSSVSALMMSGPRVYAKMADDGCLPAWFRFQTHAPVKAIAFQAVLAIAVVQVSKLQELLGYLGFTLSVSAAITVSSLFVLRYRGEAVNCPLYPLPPLVFVGATLMIAAIGAYLKPVEGLAGMVTLSVGLLVYFALYKRASQSETDQAAD